MVFSGGKGREKLQRWRAEKPAERGCGRRGGWYREGRHLWCGVVGVGGGEQTRDNEAEEEEEEEVEGREGGTYVLGSSD